jgi:hypothetical protein
MPTTVVSTTLVRPLDWPATALECGDSVDVVFPLTTVQTGAGPISPGATDMGLELLESRTPDGCMQELVCRSALHSA